MAKISPQNGLKPFSDAKTWNDEPRTTFVQNEINNQSENWGSTALYFQAV